jgi:mannose-6-phosphate isomerase-like protein (cupin superfamily)
MDLPPAGKTAPQQHLYEEVVFVLEGHGSTEVEAADDRKHVFEWGPNSLFALPLNLRHTHYNGSGQERALFALTTNLDESA